MGGRVTILYKGNKFLLHGGPDLLKICELESLLSAYKSYIGCQPMKSIFTKNSSSKKSILQNAMPGWLVAIHF